MSHYFSGKTKSYQRRKRQQRARNMITFFSLIVVVYVWYLIRNI